MDGWDGWMYGMGWSSKSTFCANKYLLHEVVQALQLPPFCLFHIPGAHIATEQQDDFMVLIEKYYLFCISVIAADTRQLERE